MFRRVARIKSLLGFLRLRIPYYGPLVKADLHKFRIEIVRASVGATLAAVAGLIFVCFFSIAVLVTVWDKQYRREVAWAICGVWGILSVVGLWYARHALSGPPPFQLVEAALTRDYKDSLLEANQQTE